MKYTCPMHPEIKENKPGVCPKCGMKLLLEKEVKEFKTHKKTSDEKDSYTPLIIILSLITVVTIALSIRDLSIGSFQISQSMAYFMGGFFLVFAGFKLIDLKGFAQGYSTYDLLAQKLYIYGYIYPFLELLLGILYTIHVISPQMNVFAFILMTFSGIGVAIKVAKHERFQCACLGTFLKIPLSKVTLIEDFGMALMALLMLLK